MLQSVRVLGFDPQTNGLHFTNVFPKGTTDYTFQVLGQTVRLGDAHNGLCGGFVFTVKDCFTAGVLPPADATQPAGGTPLFNYLVARLTNSFDPDDVTQYLSWIQMRDDDTILGGGISSHEINEEWPKIKRDLDSNQLSTLGLVRGQEPPGIGFFTGIQDLGQCHQVLAYGYDLNGSALTLHIYDPNQTLGATITLDLAHPGRTTPLSVSGYEAGHFRGFFRTRYNFHNPQSPASGAFIETVVRSPGITSAGPVKHDWSDVTWVHAAGTPLVRFTGDVHEKSFPVHVASADHGKQILQLRVVIVTGGDDLRGGTGPQDNCDAILTLASGARITIQNINSGAHWNNNETHVAVLPLPPGTGAGSITGLTLCTHFGGGLSGDNWNVDRVTLIASLLPTKVVSPPVVRTWIDRSGNPLTRLTGDVHSWSCPVAAAPADHGRAIMSLSLTIQTGGDDLRGGNGPHDNATVILTFKSGRVTIPNINQNAHWDNGQTHTVELTLPPNAHAGDLTMFELRTNFGGGFDGDNWNVNRIVLQALLAGA
jgi:hypothetical protein